jgi:hypothetical protein
VSDRLQEAIRREILALVPQIKRFGRWRYRVQTVTSTPPILVSAVPAGESEYGPIDKIKLWPGPDGSVAVPAIGSLVVLTFAEGNAGMPMIVGLDPDAPPTMVYVGEDAGPFAARVGDDVVCDGVTPGVPTGILITAPSGGGPCTVTTGSGPTAVKFTGDITSGSAKVRVP